MNSGILEAIEERDVIVSKAASAHHTWIASAINSSTTSLYGWLVREGKHGMDLVNKRKHYRLEENRDAVRQVNE